MNHALAVGGLQPQGPEQELYEEAEAVRLRTPSKSPEPAQVTRRGPGFPTVGALYASWKIGGE